MVGEDSLMFTHNLNPVIVNLGPVQIRWYGVIFVLGFVIGYFLINQLAKKRHLNMTEEDTADFLMYLIIGTLLGARIFYILFYNLKFYLANPLLVFAVWQGGLSFHGGFVGSILAGLYFCSKKKINFYKLADIVVIPLTIGLALGRIANFINGELVGRVTDVPWCFNFPGYEGCRHPSQLYESAKNLLIFSTLWIVKEKKLKDGALFWLFIFMYGVLRFFIGFVRSPDQQVGFIILELTMGQLLNTVMILLGGIMFRKSLKSV